MIFKRDVDGTLELFNVEATLPKCNVELICMALSWLFHQQELW